MPSSTGTLVFNDQKIQAPDIYATESLGVGVSDPTSNLQVVGNAYVSSNLEVGTANLFVDTTTGRVGVGTGSPDEKLHVYTDSASSSSQLFIRNANASNRAGLSLINSDNEYFNIQHTTGNSNAAIIENHSQTNGGVKFYTKGDGRYEFRTTDSNNTRMVIENNGNVGIGTTDPIGLLDIRASSTDPGAVPTVHIGDAAADAGDYGMVNLVRHATTGGSKCHLSFIRNGHTVFGMGYYNNTNAFGLWGSFSSVTNTPAMLFNTDGTVRVGSTYAGNVAGKFRVDGTAGAVGSVSYFNRSGSNFYYGNASLGSVSIYANYGIAAGDYIAASDRRIKDNITDVDDGSALETLRLLKPKRYTYRDTIHKGEEPVWGFIAQEVRDTLPYATTLIKDTVPNIYELANVSSSNVITFTNFNTSNLEANATTIRVMTKEDKEERVTLAEVIDEHTIRVEEDLTDWTGSLDESGNVVAGNQLFIYGQEVDDFVFLKKDAIWTVATSALQEVDRQLQAEKARNDALEARLSALEALVQQP